MTAEELIAHLEEQGVQLSAHEGRLRYSAPPGVLTPELKAQLGAHKPALLALLAARVESGGAAARAIPRIPRDGNLPLSPAQESMWFLDQFSSQHPVYNIVLAYRIEGPLDAPALEWSINEIIRRHEILGASCALAGGTPELRIDPAAAVAIDAIDLRHLPPDRREAEARRRATEMALRPFDLAVAPLLRAALYRIDDDTCIFLLVTHHFVVDGWSLQVLARELAALYAAHCAGRASPLPALEVQYVDAAHWFRNPLRSAQLERELAHWKEQLRGVPDLMDLPADRPRPPVLSHAGASQAFELSPALSESVNAFSRAEGATLFMTLMAAFQALLHRYTHQDDLVVATIVSNRPQAEMEPLIGLFANQLLVRGNAGGNPSFREFLGRIRDTAIDAYAHQDLAFEKIVEALQPQRSLDRMPLAQVMFLLHGFDFGEVLELAGLRVSAFPIELGVAMYDLSLLIMRRADRLGGVVEYSTALFDRPTIERFITHFKTLLAEVVANPDVPISRVRLLADEECPRGPAGWETAVRGRLCVHEQVARMARQTPEATALVCADTRLSYAELNARANRLAHRLRALGVGPEVVVGICLERSADMVVGLLGTLKAGGAYVPLDPEFPRERLAFILDDACVAALVTQTSRLAQLPVGPELPVVCLDRRDELAAYDGAREPECGATQEHLAYRMYTSGSTGRPKGVEVLHQSLTNFLESMQKEPGCTARDVLLAVTTISFDIAGLEMYLPLVTGGTVVIAPQDAVADGARLARLLDEHAVTVMQATPATWQLLLAAGWRGRRELTILCGGEALSPALADELVERAGAVWNLYGPTETTIWSTLHKLAPRGDSQARAHAVPIGRPIANTGVYILDEWLQPVPPGVIGELVIGGAGVARGYWKRPELTREKFVQDPFSAAPGARMYRTGDLARARTDGNIEYLGRADGQVKLRGHRIELGEIEAALAQHAAVREVAAVMHGDRPDNKRLVAYVVPVGKAESAGGAALQDYLKEKLPAYMVPSAIVALESLPLTPNRKVDRKALAMREVARTQPEKAYVAPGTELERQLADIEAEVLGLERVGVHDDFFDLGGHSLLAVRIMARIGRACGVDLSVRALFEAPTIRGLAARIESAKDGRAAPGPGSIPRVARARGSTTFPLSAAQLHLWFLYQFAPDVAVYTVPAPVRLRGALNVATLRKSIEALVERHESLRTQIDVVDGEQVQIVSERAALDIPLLDLSHLPPADREAEAHRMIGGRSPAPLPSGNGPPVTGEHSEAGRAGPHPGADAASHRDRRMVHAHPVSRSGRDLRSNRRRPNARPASAARAVRRLRRVAARSTAKWRAGRTPAVLGAAAG